MPTKKKAKLSDAEMLAEMHRVILRLMDNRQELDTIRRDFINLKKSYAWPATQEPTHD